MAEFRKILISGSNVYGRELYASDMSEDSDSSLQVVIWNSADDRFYITGTYANAGTSASFEGEYQGDIDLTTTTGDSNTREIVIGKDRDTEGEAKLILSTGSANTGFEIRREAAENGDSVLEQHGTGSINMVLQGDVSNTSSFKVVRGGFPSTNLFEVTSDGRIFLPQLTSVQGGLNLTFNPSSGEISFSISTKRLKNNITPLSKDLLLKFDKLNPVTFNYTFQPEVLQGGFIAEEIAEVDPLLARWGPNYKTSEDGLISLDQDPEDDTQVPITLSDRAILALTVAKIQELDKKIEELKKLKQNGSV